MTTPTPVPHHVETPALSDTDVIDPDGKVTGALTIRYTKGRAAYVSTDHRPVNYRGHEFGINVHLTRDDDGTWQPERDPYVKYRDSSPAKPAPPTYLASLMAAIIRTVAHHWTPEVDRKAAYAHAIQRLRTLAPQRDNALAELTRIETERATHLATVTANENRDTDQED